MKIPASPKHLLCTVALSLLPCSVVLAQGAPEAPAAPAANTQAASSKSSMDRALSEENNWYFSWGYSRQQYQDSDIHVSQPGLGNDFTLHGVKGSDFPTSTGDTLKSLTELDLTNPQENVRIGKFMNPEKTFAIEFSLDHSKYNVDYNQTLPVTGTIANAPAPASLTTPGQFDYALHNGLNHLMINAVWFKHLAGPEKKPGDLQLVSRVGAGILLPHAENTILGNSVQVGPKNDNICCFSKGDWWQINGWTAGVEVGLRYTVYKTIFLELTSKWAYGQLRGVPVYQGSADQTLIMNEQILSTGFLF
jgi:opacity protein-like surface antigen